MSLSRPLQNRVDPFGALTVTSERGLLMGNRGGKFHNDDRTLGRRRWTSLHWIICRCLFKGRHREVWGGGYTELFFLDEPTALAAGHRPCFECRREDAKAFLAACNHSTAPELDAVLNAERLEAGAKRLHRRPIDELPDGAMIVQDGEALAVRGDGLCPWSFNGYGAPRSRPRGLDVDVLTPPTSLAALSAGFAPLWAAM